MPGPAFVHGDDVSLHVPVEADADFLARHRNDPAVRRWFGWTEPRTGRTIVENYREDDGSGVNFLVVSDETPVGEAFLYDVDEANRRAGIGYWVAPDEQGNGYAAAGAELLVEYAFAERGFHRLEAIAYAINEGSQRVLERLGFEREGTLRDWGRLDGEWINMSATDCWPGNGRTGEYRRPAQSPSSRPMIICWISLVPSPISISLASR